MLLSQEIMDRPGVLLSQFHGVGYRPFRLAKVTNAIDSAIFPLGVHRKHLGILVIPIPDHAHLESPALRTHPRTHR